MKEFTQEEIQRKTVCFQKAKAHLTQAIGELRAMLDEMKMLEERDKTYFSPFGSHGELQLWQMEDKHLAEYQRNLEHACWKTLIEQSGITVIATEEDRKRIDKAVTDGTFGTFSEAAIQETLANLKRNETLCIKHLAEEVFRHFSPDYAKRLPIGSKVVKACGSYGSISFTNYHFPCWEQLEKLLLTLDHKPLPQQQSDSIVGQMDHAARNHQPEFVCPYFKAKFYEKSLTAHLTFTRMDLVSAINELGKVA